MTNQPLTVHEFVETPARATSPGRLRTLARALTASQVGLAGPVLRLALAVAIFPHGAQKLLGWFGGAGFSGTIDAFGQYFGVAAPLAVLSILTEFFAPIALALGGFTRLAALAIGLDMLVAARFHLANGFFMNWFGNQAGEGFEYHILAVGIALTLVIVGAGRASLDRRIHRALEE